MTAAVAGGFALQGKIASLFNSEDEQQTAQADNKSAEKQGENIDVQS